MLFFQNYEGNEILYSMMIRNWYKTSTFENKDTPYHRFFHKYLDLKMFYPFGYLSLYYIPLPRLTKLTIAVERVNLIVISHDGLFYQIFRHLTQFTVESRDLTFVEDKNDQLPMNNLCGEENVTKNAYQSS